MRRIIQASSLLRPLSDAQLRRYIKDGSRWLAALLEEQERRETERERNQGDVGVMAIQQKNTTD